MTQQQKLQIISLSTKQAWFKQAYEKETNEDMRKFFVEQMNGITNELHTLMSADIVKPKKAQPKVESKTLPQLDPAKYQTKPITFNKGFVNFGYKQGCNAFTLLALFDQGKLAEFLNENRAQILKAQSEYLASLV